MNIAYISTYLPQQCGIATYSNYLVTALCKLNKTLNVRIIAENKASSYRDDFLEITPVWSRRSDYSKPIIRQTKNFDIVHIQHEYDIFQYDKRLIETLDGISKKVKKIATIHCVKPLHFSENKNIEKYTKQLADRLDSIIVHLPSQKSTLQRLGIDPNKIKIIPHGTELTDINQTLARQKMHLPKAGKILLMFGFIKAHKYADIVLDVLKDINQKVPDTYFFLAGGLAPNPSDNDFKYLKFLKSKIKKSGLKNNVVFPNHFFPNEDVPFLISASDIVLFPYYEQDFSASGSLHLSIGANKPVIATRIPKFEELKNISDELLILPNNPQMLKNLVLRLFQDTDFFNYIIKRTNIYRKKTAWDTIAKQHLKLYYELIS